MKSFCVYVEKCLPASYLHRHAKKAPMSQFSSSTLNAAYISESVWSPGLKRLEEPDAKLAARLAYGPKKVFLLLACFWLWESCTVVTSQKFR